MKFILISISLIVLLTIGTGVFMIYNNMAASRKRLKKILKTNLFVFLPLLIISIITLVPQVINAATSQASDPDRKSVV